MQFSFVQSYQPDQGKYHDGRVHQPAGARTEHVEVKMGFQPFERLLAVTVHEPLARDVFPVKQLDTCDQYTGDGSSQIQRNMLPDETASFPNGSRSKRRHRPEQRNQHGNNIGGAGQRTNTDGYTDAQAGGEARFFVKTVGQVNQYGIPGK